MLHKPLFNHHDLVTEDQCFIDAVGHEHDAGTFLLLNAEKFPLHLFPREIVESREWLIHQDKGWLVGQCPGDGRALLHAAGKLGRVCLFKAGQVHRGDDVLDLLLIDLIFLQ